MFETLTTYIEIVPPDTRFVFSAAFSALIAVFTLWRALVERGPSARRAKAILAHRQVLYADLQKPNRRGLNGPGMNIARKTVTKFKLLGGEKAREAQTKLFQAGFRTRDALTLYLFVRVVMPTGMAAVAIALTYGINLWDLGTNGNLMACVAAVLIGYVAPDIYVRNAADRRRQELRRALPDTLDLMVICTEAGLNLDSALVRVAREIRGNCPELADELELTSVELGFLSDRRQALGNLEARTGLPTVGALVSTLAQAEKYGTPLAQSLRVLAREMRDERMMKAEEKAARLPAILTVPMVTFILPSLFVVILAPAVLRTIDSLSGL